MIKHRTNKKRVITLFLTVCMCVVFSSITVFAQTAYWPEGFFGHIVTVNVIKLSNGTEA